MIQTSRIISIYAADTSGVCSMLYELGGLIVVHDASGCNSTYSTHDEPRWYAHDSAIYISALTEMQAVLGDDEKIISDTVEVIREIKPRFAVLCGSPMPMMIGTDFDALAAEVELRTGIPTFGLHTNGMHSYLTGASEALARIVGHFCTETVAKSERPSANIIGATPLDFSLNGSVTSIRRWLEDTGYDVISCMCMDSTLDDIARAGSAHVNLVVSSCGLETARLLQDRFQTPFVAGVPLGKTFSEELKRALNAACETGESSYPCASAFANVSQGASDNGAEQAVAIVGEPVFAGSLARSLSQTYGLPTRMLTQLEHEGTLMAPTDAFVASEDDMAREFSRARAIVCDPLFDPIRPMATPLVPLPHEAFSGRCFSKRNPNLTGDGMERYFDADGTLGSL